MLLAVSLSHSLFNHRIGRPRLTVDIEDIEYLRSVHFSWTKISQILEISRSTLYRRLDEFNLSCDLTFSNISDQELDTIITDIKRDHPNDGERLTI